MEGLAWGRVILRTLLFLAQFQPIGHKLKYLLQKNIEILFDFNKMVRAILQILLFLAQFQPIGHNLKYLVQ
jgi:hypothetical protein